VLNHASGAENATQIPQYTLSVMNAYEGRALMSTGSEFLDQVPVMPARAQY
jgi:hypothetical protein